jgi:hypothetical protein
MKETLCDYLVLLNSNLTHQVNINGNNVVYSTQRRQIGETVLTKTGYEREFEQGVIVCGNLVPQSWYQRLLGFRQKVRPISQDKRDFVKEGLLKQLDYQPAFIDFK